MRRNDYSTMKEMGIKRFIECYIPVKACNMKCEYCYVTQNGWWSAEKPDLSFCCSKIKEAFSQKRLGGICMINMCATGETMLAPEVPFIIQSILENGHYVMVVTNGSLTKRFDECCQFPENLRSHLFFKFSLHYLELKRQTLLDTFFDNVRKIHESGISFTVEITPDDSYIPYIPEIKNSCMKNLGAFCHVTVSRDERKKDYPLLSRLTRDEFVEIWSEFDSILFTFKESIFEVKRKEFCYAGEWSFVLDLGTGDYRQCYKGKKLGNFYENINAPLHLLPVGHNCIEAHCFNGHAFLGFGLIPEFETPDYADMRNRVLPNKDQWLSKTMEKSMRCRLKDANKEKSKVERFCIDFLSFNYKGHIRKILGK